MPAQATVWSQRDKRVLHGVFLTPWATAEQLARIRRFDSVSTVRTSLSSLIARGLVFVVPYRGGQAHARVNLHYVSAAGVSQLEELLSWKRTEGYRGASMASRQWQRHLGRHPDLVQLAYGLCAGLADILEEDRPLEVYFPRQGSFDALMWRSFSEGLSVGIIRKGPLLTEQRMFARLKSIQSGDKLLNFHKEYGGHRGPSVILIVVQTQFEKAWVGRLFRPLGKLWMSGMLAVIATEEEAHSGLFTVCRDPKVTVDAGSIAALEPSPSTYNPIAPTTYRFHPPVSSERLPALLGPVQRRILDCLFRWPLMRPTEIASTIGTGYAGRFNDYLHGLRELGLLKNVRDLEAEWLMTYDPQEYRNLPLLLSDK